jgi:hypothetical protein
MNAQQLAIDYCSTTDKHNREVLRQELCNRFAGLPVEVALPACGFRLADLNTDVRGFVLEFNCAKQTVLVDLRQASCSVRVLFGLLGVWLPDSRYGLVDLQLNKRQFSKVLQVWGRGDE